jgi:ABC-type multidrug transport system ATPase subunit
MTQAVPLLAVRGISKRYGEATVLDDVEFDLSPGEILGIIGPNGAGKTTLMECLVDLLPADGGEVRLHGEPLPAKDRKSNVLSRSMADAECSRQSPSLGRHGASSGATGPAE